MSSETTTLLYRSDSAELILKRHLLEELSPVWAFDVSGVSRPGPVQRKPPLSCVASRGTKSASCTADCWGQHDNVKMNSFRHPDYCQRYYIEALSAIIIIYSLPLNLRREIPKRTGRVFSQRSNGIILTVVPFFLLLSTSMKTVCEWSDCWVSAQVYCIMWLCFMLTRPEMKTRHCIDTCI